MEYEVLWYNSKEYDTINSGDPVFRSFKTRKQAMTFYEQHKNDEDKSGWWVTKRDRDGYVIEDIVY